MDLHYPHLHTLYHPNIKIRYTVNHQACHQVKQVKQVFIHPSFASILSKRRGVIPLGASLFFPSSSPQLCQRARESPAGVVFSYVHIKLGWLSEAARPVTVVWFFEEVSSET